MRVETTHTNLYKFKQLSEKSQAKALDNNRYFVLDNIETAETLKAKFDSIQAPNCFC